MKYFLFILTIFSVYSNASFAQKQVEGVAVRIIDNKKGIYHYKNEFHRKVLIKEATLDAIEKGADISIKNIASYNVENASIHNYERSFEDYVSKTLQEYHVIWRRSSQFQFSRDKNHMKRWICRVSGEVIRKEFDSSDIDDEATPTVNSNPISENSYYIVRKRLGKVHISAGLKDGVRIGDKFIVNKFINKKNLVDHKTIKRTKAHIFITDVGNDYAIGNVKRGYFRQLESNTVEKGNFKLNRGVIKYELFKNEKVNKTTTRNKDNIDNEVVSVLGHGFSFTHWNFRGKWGVQVELGFVNVRKSADSKNYINIKFGGFRSFTILPGLFYLQPTFSLGYVERLGLRDYLNKDNYMQVTFPLSLETKLGGVFTLNFIELSAGMSYKYFNIIKGIPNFYPYIGVGVNLY